MGYEEKKSCEISTTHSSEASPDMSASSRLNLDEQPDSAANDIASSSPKKTPVPTVWSCSDLLVRSMAAEIDISSGIVLGALPYGTIAVDFSAEFVSVPAVPVNAFAIPLSTVEGSIATLRLKNDWQ